MITIVYLSIIAAAVWSAVCWTFGYSPADKEFIFIATRRHEVTLKRRVIVGRRTNERTKSAEENKNSLIENHRESRERITKPPSHQSVRL